MILIGEKDLSVDDKGRLILPSAYRDSFTEGKVIFTLGMDQCLNLYPQSVYAEMASKYQRYNTSLPAARAAMRAFTSNSYLTEIDAHNRILLPKKLIDKRSIGRKVTLVGMMDHLELWDSEVYKKVSLQNDEDYANNMMNLDCPEKKA